MSEIDRNPEHLFPAFREKIVQIIADMDAWTAIHLPSYKAAMAEGFRTTARQKELYAQGRDKDGAVTDRKKTVTYKNGTTNPSNHQSGLAADIAFERDGELTWDVPDVAWAYLRHLAHVQGLVSGSDWQTFKDEPHIEWPTSDKATYQAAAKWRKQVGIV
ncbi:MAG: M15 family metallopeptidase [Armatimonadetes bacterium]|nr:M15 family metallopeptidase [Armatimonadota bacterium]